MTASEADTFSGQVQHPVKPSLLAIVSVEKDQAVLCQHNGCNHQVHRKIHVVDEAGHLLVLGSSCIKKRYGETVVLGKPSIGGAHGRQLTTEERQLLEDNTAALLERFRQEEMQQGAHMLARLRASSPMPMRGWQQMPPARPVRPQWHHQSASKQPPWPWVKPLSSVAYFRLRDQTCWVRVLDRDNTHIIMPWPSFEGWDEALPPTVGKPSHERGGYLVSNVTSAVAFLDSKSAVKRRVGNWSEVVPTTQL